MALARSAGLAKLADQHLSVPTDKGANPGLKVASLVAGMVAGADSIDDMAVQRHGGMGRVFTNAYAPSTLGSFLRSFTFGHYADVGITAMSVTLDAVAARFLTGLAAAGRGRSVRAFALATRKKLRTDPTSAKVLFRADSALYGRGPVLAWVRAGAQVSVTVRLDPLAKATIAAIPTEGWMAIEYTHAVFDETTSWSGLGLMLRAGGHQLPRLGRLELLMDDRVGPKGVDPGLDVRVLQARLGVRHG